MAFSKAHKFNREEYTLSILCKALSHPARIRILQILKHNGTTSAHELFREIPLARPTVSQHLTILRRCGTVSFYEQFPSVLYTLDEECERFMDKIQ
jgi:DNA-binding transcriptional ArsR family regulator